MTLAHAHVSRKTLADDAYKSEEARLSDDIAAKVFARYQNRFALKHLFSRQNAAILQALSSVQDLAKSKLLDIGCGFGNFLADAHSRVFEAHGIDLGPWSVEAARRILPRTVSVQVGDGETLPHQDETFDFVVMKGILHHLGKPDRVLREAHRVLKPGGAIVIFEGDSSSPYRNLALSIADLLRMPHETSHFEHIAPAEIIQLLDQAGFAGVSLRPVSGLFVPPGLLALGGRRVWPALDRVEAWLDGNVPSLFRWHALVRGRKPSEGTAR